MILSVQNAHKHFGGVAAVNNGSFVLKKNSITALIGPNGAGKTTMFDLITGITIPDTGHIIFRGEDITKLSCAVRARKGIARTFQMIRIFPELTALENVMIALQGTRDGFWHAFMPFTNEQKGAAHKARSLLALVHIEEKAHTKAGSLSYGQQKLLEIARAIATDSELILLDEPAAGVNRTLLHTIVSLIKKLKQDGKTVLIIEHDMGFVMNLCEHVIVLDYGKEIADGTPQEIQKNPRVLEAYLGAHHA